MKRIVVMSLVLAGFFATGCASFRHSHHHGDCCCAKNDAGHAKGCAAGGCADGEKSSADVKCAKCAGEK